MCIIFAAYSTKPPESLLHQGARANRDGAGVAWFENGKIRWEKGFEGGDADEVIKLMKRLEPPFVIHFRVATVGGPLPSLTHPFPVTPNVSLDLKGAADTVLFHNGHFAAWEYELKQGIYLSRGKVPGGPWSDSRALACLAGRFSPNTLKLLPSLGDDRVLFFSSLRKGAFLKFGPWHDNGGFLSSRPVSIPEEKPAIKFTDRRGEREGDGVPIMTHLLPAPPVNLDKGSFWNHDEAREVLVWLKKERMRRVA